MSTGVESAVGAARLAGYTDRGGNESASLRVTAHRMMQDPKILDAIEECTRATLRGLAPVAVSRAKAILEDPKHSYHARMIETVLDRTGFFAKSEHTMRVEHSVDVRELEELARRLARENGISAEKLTVANQLPATWEKPGAEGTGVEILETLLAVTRRH
jgi:hypothetical protein